MDAENGDIQNQSLYALVDVGGASMGTQDKCGRLNCTRCDDWTATGLSCTGLPGGEDWDEQPSNEMTPKWNSGQMPASAGGTDAALALR